MRDSASNAEGPTTMPHETPLIATIVAGLGLAFVFGALANRLRFPPLVGYLFAGIVVGPRTPGFVADQALAAELAELGVILLMFGVGLHFKLKDLLAVKNIAIPGAVVQIAAATAMGTALALVMGWTVGAGLVFGLALSVASTVVLLRALQERREIETERGRIAVGWLIVEDLAMVLALVLLPPLAGLLGGNAKEVSDPVAQFLGLGLTGVILLTFAKVVIFVVLILVVGKRFIPWVLHSTAHTGSRELFRLAVLAVVLGVAFGAAKLFGVSFALGAFFAGMIMGESELSHRAAEETLPLRDAFSVLFFVAVGMLFNPASLLEDPLPIVATVLIILFGKSLAAFLIVLAFKHPLATALTISASLAQIGEFSFILAELGVQLGLLSEQGRDLILAGALLSIVLNPLSFKSIDWAEPLLDRIPFFRGKREAAAADAAAAELLAAEGTGKIRQPMTGLKDHIVLVGYGRVGKLVGQHLTESGQPYVVIEDADKLAGFLRESGIETIAGNAVRPDNLAAANLAQALHLVVAIPNAFEAGQVVAQAHGINPDLVIYARAHSDAEVEHLAGLGADVVIMGEREIARGIIGEIVRRQAPAARPAE
jgi:CPA2 family monovalent cation:H+ antiporter-2